MRTKIIAKRGTEPTWERLRPTTRAAVPAGSDHAAFSRVSVCPCDGHCPRCAPAVQPKLSVGAPNDRYEQEADRVADEVMSMPEPARPSKREKDEQPAAPVGSSHAGGQPLPPATRAFFEPRFGCDLGGVRVRTDSRASDLARTISARAFTVGGGIAFGAQQYSPGTQEGKRILAHELTHVIQQRGVRPAPANGPPGKDTGPPGLDITADGAAGTARREPSFPDDTCASVQENIRAAWPVARRWVSLARTRLSEPTAVAGALQRHFRIDPNDPSQAADLEVVRDVLRTMEGLFDTRIDNRCNEPNTEESCELPDGRKYAAFVHSGRPEDGITHCRPSADVGFLGRIPLVDTLVHEIAHLADPNSTDYAYLDEPVVTTYEDMTRAQAIHNGDSYSEFVRDMFTGRARTPMFLGLDVGTLIASGRPRFVVGASYNVRGQSGIEVFDLVGGVHSFIALDVGAPEGEPVTRDVGFALDFGVLTRSAETHLFADVRAGAFYTADVSQREPDRVGLSVHTLLGWADSGFRAGFDAQFLFDFLSHNHAVIIGGEFNWGP